MKRPAGIVVAAILVSLFAAGMLLVALGTLFDAVMFRHGLPAATTASATTPLPPAGVLVAIFIVLSLFFLAGAAWAVATVVGLLRLRNWARYSVLVLGGLLAFFGIASALMMALLPSILAASGPAAVPPNVMHAILAALALFYIAIAAVGVWWLTYFNLRSVKAYFLPQYAAQPAYIFPTAESLATPGGLAPPPPPPVLEARPGRFTHVPTAIVVIGCLLLFSAACCLVFAFLPLPGFFLGFFFSGYGTHVLYAAFAVITGLIGWGLLRLNPHARLACFALIALGVVNMVLSLTPWFRARALLYQAAVRDSMHLPPPTAAMTTLTQGPMLTISFVIGLVMYGIVAAILMRHRAAFKRPSA